MLSKSVEAASNLPLPLLPPPSFGSGFVPTASTEPLHSFADHQPFTPIIETGRKLLLGGDIGSSRLIAVSWCAAITVVGSIWARRLYTTTLHANARRAGCCPRAAVKIALAPT
jgi:ABC-2 type transport system permease protein